MTFFQTTQLAQTPCDIAAELFVVSCFSGLPPDQDVIHTVFGLDGQDFSCRGTQAALDAVSDNGAFVSLFCDRKADAFDAEVIGKDLDDEAL